MDNLQTVRKTPATSTPRFNQTVSVGYALNKALIGKINVGAARNFRRMAPQSIAALGDRAVSTWERLMKDGAKEDAATKAVIQVANTNLLPTLRVTLQGNVEVRLHARLGQEMGALITTIR